MKREIWRLAWNETEFRDIKKVLGGLGFGVLTIIFNWVASLRTWQQALLFIACSVAAYLFLLVLELVYRYVLFWIRQRNQIVITTPEELESHYLKLENCWCAMQGPIDDFKDIYKEVERCWQEQRENKTDPETMQFNKMFPRDVVTAAEIEPFEDQLMIAGMSLAKEYRNIQKLLNIKLRLE